MLTVLSDRCAILRSSTQLPLRQRLFVPLIRFFAYGVTSSERLDVIKQCHKTEVHVKLLMAVEEGHSWIIGDKVDLSLLIAAEHDYVLHQAG